MEEQLVSYLKKEHLHIVTAESCTGGLIASGIVAVSGASDVFSEGYVTYSEEAKHRILGVSFDTIRTYHVVSREVVTEMAVGAKKVAGAEVSVATTGFAGPGGGTDEIPVGTVWIGCCVGTAVFTKKLQLNGTREIIRQKAKEEAILFVCECLKCCNI